MPPLQIDRINVVQYLAADNVVLHEDCTEVSGKAIDRSVSNVAHKSSLARSVGTEKPIPDGNVE